MPPQWAVDDGWFRPANDFMRHHFVANWMTMDWFFLGLCALTPLVLWALLGNRLKKGK